MQGLKFGVCKYEVTLPELDGGRGVTLAGEAKVGSLKFPGEGARLDTARLLERSLSAWALAGLGWLMPNLVVLGLIMLRRRRHSRRQSSSATP